MYNVYTHIQIYDIQNMYLHLGRSFPNPPHPLLSLSQPSTLHPPKLHVASRGKTNISSFSLLSFLIIPIPFYFPISIHHVEIHYQIPTTFPLPTLVLLFPFTLTLLLS